MALEREDPAGDGGGAADEQHRPAGQPERREPCRELLAGGPGAVEAQRLHLVDPPAHEAEVHGCPAERRGELDHVHAPGVRCGDAATQQGRPIGDQADRAEELRSAHEPAAQPARLPASNLTGSGWFEPYGSDHDTRAAGAGKGDAMSTNEMLWVILQDRRRQAADAARERLATRSTRLDEAAEEATVRPSPAHQRTLRPADGVRGR
jgi:hypothetical protein